MSLGCTLPPAAHAQERLLTFERGVPAEIRVDQGKFVNARTSGKVSRVVVGNPEIATAVPLTDTTLYVLGKAEGRTNFAVYGTNDTLLGLVNVEVGTDVSDLQQTIQNAVPQAKVRVETINGRTRLSGAVPDGISQRKILEIAEQYSSAPVINAMNVTGGQQVLIEVRVVEANRNAGRQLGVSWFARAKGTGIATGTAASQRGINVGALFPNGNSPFGTVLAQILGGGISADVLIQALEEKGLGRRLAEPNLTALSGEKASFLVGGEVPIPVAENDGKVTVQYKEYGVRLNFTPVVLDSGLINLKLEPEVSQVDENTAIRSATIEIPAFITRRASTTIEIRDGQSLAMAGLLQSLHRKTQDQLPWLGQVPVLGALFRSSSFQEEETDLVIIVTPHLVRPAKPGQPLRTPLDSKSPSNDAEFFLLGQMEVSNDLQRRFAEGTDVIGPFGHIVDLKPEVKNVSKKIVKR
ncbi:pilus assembly protein CpaC [Microvirga subterranea]|uniref:Pilus assembly protein CpaC n=1 Tax=Microvirga subterranea TaxID=186651 RepID=A0A370HJK7_9HYPH|nr:pilus assembly protein CpaC [Microvirga subterranea]